MKGMIVPYEINNSKGNINIPAIISLIPYFLLSFLSNSRPHLLQLSIWLPRCCEDMLPIGRAKTLAIHLQLNPRNAESFDQ